MRRAVVLVVTVCIFITACSQITGRVAQPEYLVFVLAGESNMEGRGDTSKLPENLKVQSKNIEFYQSGRFESITAHTNFGPEVALADELVRVLPNRKIMLVKHAQSSSPLDTLWSPDRTLYKDLVDNIRKSTSGRDVEFGAVIWYGGGGDARSNGAAMRYQENFQRFIEALRKDIGSDSVPFIYAQVNLPANDFPFREQVRQAQMMIEQKVPNTKMVSSDGLSTISDNLHFDANGQIELGKRFAQAYLQISKNGSSK